MTPSAWKTTAPSAQVLVKTTAVRPVAGSRPAQPSLPMASPFHARRVGDVNHVARTFARPTTLQRDTAGLHQLAVRSVADDGFRPSGHSAFGPQGARLATPPIASFAAPPTPFGPDGDAKGGRSACPYTAIALPPGSADVLATRRAIGWDLPAELAEIDRVVRPDGVAVHLIGLPYPAPETDALHRSLLAADYTADTYHAGADRLRRYWRRGKRKQP